MSTFSRCHWSMSCQESVHMLQAKALHGVYSNPGFAVKYNTKTR